VLPEQVETALLNLKKVADRPKWRKIVLIASIGLSAMVRSPHQLVSAMRAASVDPQVPMAAAEFAGYPGPRPSVATLKLKKD